jgi:N-acetylglucosaminyl-diphospho-decaprenol L-rhamnosyltransferase
MHVVICIVGYRNVDDIENCLEAVAASNHRDFEVVICENGGKASFETLEARLPRTLRGGQVVTMLMASMNLGYAGGVNRCIQVPTTIAADAWWVLNPDTMVHPDALSALVRRLNVGDCDLVGGTLLSRTGSVESRAGRWRPWLARCETICAGDVETIERQASFISGACMLVSRRFLEGVGPMREDYFLYCEEVEWCLRGIARGFRLGYSADAEITHLGGTTTGAVSDFRARTRTPVYLDERNKMLLSRDHNPGWLPLAAPMALVLLLLRYGKRRAWRQVGYAVSGWAAGIANRRGMPGWLTS